MERKHALITGASHGIGQAIAIELAKNGYDIGINYNKRKEGAEETQKTAREYGARAEIFQADIGNYNELKGLFESYFKAFGTIDLMVNNAGITRFYPLLEATVEQWEEVTNIDWKGTYFCTQMAARNMVENKKKGVIINISSNHVDACWPHANIYAPSKAAVAKFTENAALELAPYGIRVLTLAPGYTDTRGGDIDLSASRVTKRIPLQRFAHRDEIAKIAVFLASDACAYMTGTRITADGGALLPAPPDNKYTPYDD